MRLPPHLATIIPTVLLIVAAVLLPAHVSQAARGHAAAPPLGQVRYIYRGLTVQPPHQGRHAGHKQDPLYDQYGLLTQQNQKASVGFHDGTVLQMNQDTNAVLTAHLTQVQHGEVAEYLAPGTNHRVQTSAAVASAIGTVFDVRMAGNRTVFVVLHGALQVSNQKGAVVVKSNHETSVIPGHKPLPPSPVDALAVFAWTDGIPAPDLGEDIALDANGGQIVSFSSQRAGPADTGHVEHINDGLLTKGWESAPGKTANQTVTVGFAGGNFYRISDVIIDPAATYGDPSSEDLKNFAIRVSSTTTADSAFTTVFQGTAQRQSSLQHFHLPVPVRAKYVQLVAQDNYGSTQRIAVAEWEVVATASLFALPAGVAVDSHGFLYVADANANRIDRVNGHGTIVAHWGSKGNGNGQFVEPSGVAIGPDGNVYVADTGNGRIQVFGPSGRFLRAWGSPGVNDGQFQYLRGIAVDPKGTVYVADVSGSITNLGTFSLRIQKFSPTGKLLAAFNDLADAGRTPGSAGIAMDPQGNLWVADYGADTILKVSAQGKVLETIGGPGKTPGKFDSPVGIAVDRSGNVYVADLFNSRIQRIGSGGFVQSWGQFGSGRGQYEFPEGVAADNAGNLYVADTHGGRIEKLRASNGKVEAVWGKYATIPTILGQTNGVAVDPHGDVWVTDSTNDRVQVRSPGGQVLAVLGYHGFVHGERNTQGLGQFWNPQGIAIAPNGEVFVADTNNCRIEELAPRGPIGLLGGGKCGTGPGQFVAPYAVALDRQGNLYVADTHVGTALTDRVLKLSPNGKVLWTYHAVGLGPGKLDFPVGIAVDRAGNVYVSNRGNPLTGSTDSRIVKLSPAGKPLATWGTADPLGQSRFFGPEGLAVDGQNHLYVADLGHSAVQKLSSSGKVLAVFTLPNRAQPTAVAIDQKGDIYVADGPNQRVIKLAPTGEVLAIWT
jgi:sugar lactone lactonase YvrE